MSGNSLSKYCLLWEKDLVNCLPILETHTLLRPILHLTSLSDYFQQWCTGRSWLWMHIKKLVEALQLAHSPSLLHNSATSNRLWTQVATRKLCSWQIRRKPCWERSTLYQPLLKLCLAYAEPTESLSLSCLICIHDLLRASLWPDTCHQSRSQYASMWLNLFSAALPHRAETFFAW